jgi:hypothetical protein
LSQSSNAIFLESLFEQITVCQEVRQTRVFL